MTGYIKYFETVEKTSFIIKDDAVMNKYNEIWDKRRVKHKVSHHGCLWWKYIKAKVREFSGEIKINFLGDEVLKENEHFACIACITIDSVMRMKKKNYLQIYLEEYKHRIKKTKMTKFIEAKLELESESELEPGIELELKSDSE